ncbi:hypothetical protein FDP41_006482 [Naegleria fowleri]|uniref:Alanine racemase C-terminal domain-containing protein n=1 Tax=Naegleria fowleri TaxID=5763 RepID=A0A6A5BKA9_NAEFO|nr:uncharacterized protein FDP41_006482 [Naegleria fowleri]KAF0974450.1 hypothetical protein FDP41_006482 [Naegleria fowleri]
MLLRGVLASLPLSHPLDHHAAFVSSSTNSSVLCQGLLEPSFFKDYSHNLVLNSNASSPTTSKSSHGNQMKGFVSSIARAHKKHSQQHSLDHHHRSQVHLRLRRRRHHRHQEFPTTSVAVVNLTNILHNVENILKLAREHNSQVKIMPVVKANAYGHGDVPIVKELLKEMNIHRFAVNRVLEGVKIRKALQKENFNDVDILVLGYAIPTEVKNCVTFDLTPTISGDPLIIETLFDECVKQDKKIKVHVKIDTGMGRFGLLPNKVESFLHWFTNNPRNFPSRIILEGVFTHFSSADEKSKDYTQYQFDKFIEMRKLIETILEENPNKLQHSNEIIYHCCNSAATLFYPEMHLDMVRPGVSIYGLSPSNITNDERLPFQLRPALSLISHVARVEKLPHKSTVSYGNTYVVENEYETLALIPVGYGDGYKRINSHKSHVLIGGVECPVVGRVCMDQFVVRIPDEIADQVKVNDQVVLLGKQGDKELTCEKLSEWSHTINYEIVTALLPRLKRIYVK